MGCREGGRVQKRFEDNTRYVIAPSFFTVQLSCVTVKVPHPQCLEGCLINMALVVPLLPTCYSHVQLLSLVRYI